MENSLPSTGEALGTERQAIWCAPQLPASGWDLSVPTISSDKGSGTSPPPPTVETWKQVDRWNRSLGWFWFSYFFILVRLSLSHIGYYLNVLVWLWRIGGVLGGY